MTAAPRVLDLTLLQRKLVALGIMSELETKIRQALELQSCLGDMREAKRHFDALQSLLKTARGWRSEDRSMTESALQSMAVLMYARATVTRARHRHGDERERGPSDIKDRLTPDQLADHRALVDVRSQSLAHVYFNREVAGTEWHTGATLLIEKDRGWLPGAATRRVVLDPQTIIRLARAIPVALSILEERGQRRLNEVAGAIGKCTGKDLDRLAGECWLDKRRFFGSDAAADHALSSVSEGNWVIFEDG